MPNQNQVDPYVYPGTNTLINKFDIKDPKELQELEGLIFLSKKSDPLPKGLLDYDHLKAIHFHFFQDIYEWAGQERTVDIVKGDSYFGNQQYLTKELNKLFSKLKDDNYLRELSHDKFCDNLSFYFNEINAAHPFREGNGRTQRAFCDAVAIQAGYLIDWKQVNKEEYLKANIAGFLQANYEPMKVIFKNITTPLQNVHTVKEILLNKDTTNLLKQYVDKQIELTKNIKQKI